MKKVSSQTPTCSGTPSYFTGKCLAKCPDGWKDDYFSWMRDICIKPDCPTTHQECAGFICIPKYDDANMKSCPSAILDIASSNKGDFKNIGTQGMKLGKETVKTAEEVKAGKEAIDDLITLIKSGESILTGGAAGALYGIFKAGYAIYNLFQNGKKLYAAVDVMFHGGLGLKQCDDLKADVEKYNAELTAKYGDKGANDFSPYYDL